MSILNKWLEIILLSMLTAFISVMVVMGIISLTGLGNFSEERLHLISWSVLFLLFFMYVIIFYNHSKKGPLTVRRPGYGTSKWHSTISKIILFTSAIQIIIYLYDLLKLF